MDHVLQEAALPDRSGTDSLKWDALAGTFGREDLLPLWVADMDFKTPPCVREALHQAVDQGAFGYYKVPQRFYDSILTWEETRHGVRWEQDWIRTTNGVVSGLFHLVQAVTEPGAGILLLTPVYYPFYSIIEKTGRRTVCCPLREERGIYTVDMAAFEETIRKEKPDFFLLCSPHNPVGRVWTREELTAMLDCCRRHRVRVIADEIHHDLILPGHTHVSAASLWEGEGKPITFFSASKTFNLAGMKNSILMLPDAGLRRRFDDFEAALGGGGCSTLDYVAVTAAFEGGEAWLEALIEQIKENEALLREALAPYPVTVSPLEGTYLLWLDLGEVISREALRPFILDTCQIAPDFGSWFYPKDGETGAHIRLNLAAPRETILEAARRLVQGIRNAPGR